MTDVTNYFGSIGKDVIDVRKPPFKTATYSVYRSGAGEDLLIITNGKVAVAGAGNDTIIGVVTCPISSGHHHVDFGFA